MINDILKQSLLIWQKWSLLQKILVILSSLFLILLFLHWSTTESAKIEVAKAPLGTEATVVKGFELFDSNTWIKGEKELQMLEWRALKGQLEKEIEKFEHIKSASVILDLSLTKPAKGAVPKASIILTLEPDALLTPSCLDAITCHLVSAVHGLDPSQVAISDTQGRLYRSIGGQICERLLTGEHAKKEIEKLLTKVVGVNHYHLTLTPETIIVVVDENVLSKEAYKEIGKQCAQIAGKDLDLHCELIPFETVHTSAKKKSPYVLYLSPLLLLTLAPLFFGKKKKKHNDHEIMAMVRKVDVERLVDSIKKEEPHTIALLLSYLDPERADQVISALPGSVQEEVFAHLSDLEKEDA